LSDCASSSSAATTPGRVPRGGPTHGGWRYRSGGGGGGGGSKKSLTPGSLPSLVVPTARGPATETAQQLGSARCRPTSDAASWPAVRLRWLTGLLVVASLPVPFAVGVVSFPGVPHVAERILERDWCKASSYERARTAAARARVKLSRDARLNLQESEQMARTHPGGCRLAVVTTPAHPAKVPPRPPWNRGGAFASCPRDPSSLTGNWRHDAAGAALAVESRSERPIVTHTGKASAPGTARGQQLERACGKVATSKSVIVSLYLTGYPSASLSERVWAVADFPRWGWRAYFELH